jgi:hypothetical protein
MRLCLVFAFAFLNILTVFSQTVGVLQRDPARVSDGYRLLAPIAGTITYLIDNEGYAVRTWTSRYRPGQAAKLLPGGRLLRTANPNDPRPLDVGGAGGILEEFDWNGNLTWTFEIANDTQRLHHDVTVLPNGNVLALMWRRVSRQEMVARGRVLETMTAPFVLDEVILEIRPTRPVGGEIVWQWSALDHAVQDRVPTAPTYGNIEAAWDKIDMHRGLQNQDWLHANGVDYHPDRDEIAVSVRNLSEIFVIHRPSGRIVYRWGNPQNYNRGIPNDQRLWFQHNARWVKPGRPGYGNMTIFSNNVGRGSMPPFTSSVEEITLPLDDDGNYVVPAAPFPFEPRDPTWRFDPRQSIQQFYAPNVSGAERLPNGNTLICLGNQGTLYEVTPDSAVVWMYRNPHGANGPVRQGDMPQNNMVFTCPWYAADGPELSGKPLNRMGRIEEGPLSVRERSQPRSWVVVDGRIVVSEWADIPRRFRAYDMLGRYLGTVEVPAGVGNQRINLPAWTFIVTAAEEES